MTDQATFDQALLKRLYETMHAIPPKDRARTQWVMNTSDWNKVRRLRLRGVYLWTPALTATGDDYLMDRPVTIDDTATEITLTARPT